MEQANQKEAGGSVPIWKNKVWFLAALGFFFDSLDLGIFSFALTAIAKEWALSQNEIGLLGSVNSIGMAVGAVLAGILADRFGRRWVFLATLLLFSLGSVASALATAFFMLLAIRFCVGIGLGGELPVASTYVSETAPQKLRGRSVVLAESFWAWGWLLAAAVAYFVIPATNWRIAFLIAGVPALYALYLRRNLPESSTFARASRQKRRVPISELFQAKWIRSTVTLWVLWFAINFAYYGMFLWLPTLLYQQGFDIVKSFQYVLLMTLAQIPGYFAAAWLIEKIGRRWVLISFLLGTSVSALGFGFADSVPELLLYGALLNFFNLGAWGAVYAYTPEHYPTDLRARGAGAAAGIGRIGAILGPYLVGFMLSLGFGSSTVFTIFFAALVLAAITIFLLGPETKGREAG